MTDLDRLIAAVEAGKYHSRPCGTPRYYAFGTDSEGVVAMGRFDRMSILLKGKDSALATLRAYRATQEQQT